MGLVIREESSTRVVLRFGAGMVILTASFRRANSMFSKRSELLRRG